MNTYQINIGDAILWHCENGRDIVLHVWRKTNAPIGNADFRGPQIWAHVRPGGYGVVFDNVDIVNGIYNLEMV